MPIIINSTIHINIFFSDFGVARQKNISPAPIEVKVQRVFLSRNDLTKLNNQILLAKLQLTVRTTRAWVIFKHILTHIFTRTHWHDTVIPFHRLTQSPVCFLATHTHLEVLRSQVLEGHIVKGWDKKHKPVKNNAFVWSSVSDRIMSLTTHHKTILPYCHKKKLDV